MKKVTERLVLLKADLQVLLWAPGFLMFLLVQVYPGNKQVTYEPVLKVSGGTAPDQSSKLQ